MGELYDTMVGFFAEDGWPYTQVGDQPVLHMAFKGDSGTWTCYASAREDLQHFLFYSICPLQVPEGKRVAAAELLARANYGLLVGNFELDFGDGEIRYKTSIDVTGSKLDAALITQLVYANVMAMDVYLPAIRAVVERGEPPAEAAAAVEKG